MAKKVIFKMAAAAILNFKKINFWLRGYSICYSVQNFIKIGLFFTEIWRFNDFRNGGRLSSWILKICRFRILALVDMLFCFLIQNIAEIGQSVDELAKKAIFKMAAAAILNFKNFNFWSRVCNRVQYMMLCTKFDQNQTFLRLRYGDLTIFKMAAVRHLVFKKFAVFVMKPSSTYCFASPYKILLKSDNRSMSYGQKAIFKMAAAAILNFKNFNF